MDTHIIDKFTTHLKNVLTRALAAALEQDGLHIEPLHLLWALATEKGSIGAEILRKAKLTEVQFADDTPRNAGEPSPSATKKTVKDPAPALSDDAKRALEKAVLTANLYEHKYIGTEHLLSGLLQIGNADLKEFFEKNRIETKTMKQQVTLVLKSASKFPDIAASLGMPANGDLGDMGAMSIEPVREKRRGGKKPVSKTPALDFFSVDLTNHDFQADVDPVIGRGNEIERIMQILCRRTKNNPILLGEPGVGKTAIVEGLAKKIMEGDVPDALRDKRVLSLDLSLLIAGTMYRGEFEGRLKQIIDEAKAHPEIVLFIDEVHTIIGAGATSGSLDAANMLKPALARGDLRCIGATTMSEYKKHIESDPALERRFQAVMVNEPTPAQTLEILEGVKKNYESYHGVIITKDAITAAVDLADRYIQEKFFPDKAIDLIDEAASSVRVRRKATASQLKLREIDHQLARLREEKRQAIVEERFMEAIALKEEERRLEEDHRALARKVSKQKPSGGRIAAKHIADIVSRMTNIPVTDLIDSERERLRNLETVLERRVIGQPAAVRAVAECIRRAKTGVQNPNRPLASFLFVGPSGVGKTELAKTIADEVFQDRQALIRLDMSEFAEGFTVTKLIGAPAGYVGYKENAKLTDAVKRKPYAVVLFDELEKAHSDVLNLLLQILDDGAVTDATGRKINFKNTIIVMTSNVGSEAISMSEVGFGTSETNFPSLAPAIHTALAERFRPEFLNRIDRTIVFDPLNRDALRKIVDLQIAELNVRLKPQRIAVAIDEAVRDWIITRGTKAEHGARALRRVIQDHLENAVAALLLDTARLMPKTIRFYIENDSPVIEVEAKQKQKN